MLRASTFLAGLSLAARVVAAPAGLDPRVELVLAADASLKADPVWPGFLLTDQPLALELDGTRTVLIGHPSPPKEYRQLRGTAVPVGLRNGSLPGFKFEWDMRYAVGAIPTFAMRFRRDREPIADLDTLVHERFHVFQKTGFQTLHESVPYPELGAEHLALAGVEQRALARALAATGSAERSDAGRMFVAIRRVRNDRWGLAIRRIEDWEEQIEGTAEYATKTLLARAPFRRTGIPAGADSIAARLDRMPGPADLGKSRAYGVGATLCLLLDREGVTGWQASVAAGNPLAELASRAFPVAHGATAEMAAVARDTLGHSELLESARAEVLRQTKTRDRLLLEYRNDSGIEVRLTIPVRSYSARFAAVGPTYNLPDGSRFQPTVSELVVQETGFSLTARERALFSGGPDRAYRFRVSRNTRVTTDGRGVVLQPGVIPFRSLAMSATGFELSTDLSGTLTITADSAVIAWSDRR